MKVLPMPLNKVQNKFKETMLAPVQNLEEADHDFLSLFEDNRIPVKDRLKVYHNNVIGSLSEALQATFPLIEKLVGEDFLKQMSREFIFNHPPKGACLHQYGEGFDDFIRKYEPAKPINYLSDMATFEFALNTAYYASDDVTLEPDALSHIPPEKLGDVTLKLRNSATLMQSKFAILQIRDFCLDEGQGNKPDMSKDYNTKLLIIRPHLEVNILPLEDDEYTILRLLEKNVPLGQAVEETIETYPDFDFTAFLGKHIELETFSAIKTNGQAE